MIRKLLFVGLAITLLLPFSAGAQEEDDCDVQSYIQRVQSVLETMSSDASSEEIDNLRLEWRDTTPDSCTYQHYHMIQYALSELYISVLLRDSDLPLSQEHLDRFQDTWEEALARYQVLVDSVEIVASVETERDGKTRETAFLLGQSGSILDGQGAFVIERVIRGATYRDARALNYQRPDSGKEFLLVWATFTCEQRLCDGIQDSPFFLTGDEAVVYGNLVLVRGGEFPDQLAGQTMQGGSVSGWLWFQVSQTDTGLALMDNGYSPHFFSLSAFPPGAELLTVIAGGNVNLRVCPSTDCDIVGRAASGDQLLLLDEADDWFHIRAEDGTEGYIFSNLVRRG
jgi:hypothetical protein